MNLGIGRPRICHTACGLKLQEESPLILMMHFLHRTIENI